MAGNILQNQKISLMYCIIATDNNFPIITIHLICCELINLVKYYFLKETPNNKLELVSFKVLIIIMCKD